MKQYCRYCGYCIAETDFENVSWCDKKEKEISSASAKRINKCKDFVFCEIDAFNNESGKYKPRTSKPKKDNLQLSLF